MSDLRLLDDSEYFSPRRLRLFILPTEKCNFRCSYCYEDFSIGRMSSEIANGVIALVAARADGLDSLDIDWFGGEPLLAKDIIYKVGGVIFDICRHHDIALRSSVTTNGYLLDDDISRNLFARGITRLQVSMDGPAQIHDAQRPTAGGRPTFDTIVKNIQALLASNQSFKLLVRIHFDRNTVDEVREFVSERVRDWATDPRVDVLFAHIENLAANTAAHVPQMTFEERTRALDELRRLIPRAVSKQDIQYVCYAAQPNAFVIRADGRVGKCTVALRDDTNTIGSVTPDGKILIDNDKARPWMAGWATGDRSTLACPYSALTTVKVPQAK